MLHTCIQIKQDTSIPMHVIIQNKTLLFQEANIRVEVPFLVIKIYQDMAGTPDCLLGIFYLFFTCKKST
jgi:hypothetical protein